MNDGNSKHKFRTVFSQLKLKKRRSLKETKTVLFLVFTMVISVVVGTVWNAGWLVEIRDGRREQATLFPVCENFSSLVNKTVYLSSKCTCHTYEEHDPTKCTMAYLYKQELVTMEIVGESMWTEVRSSNSKVNAAIILISNATKKHPARFREIVAVWKWKINRFNEQ